MAIDFLTGTFAKYTSQQAIIWKQSSYTYEWLSKRINFWKEELKLNQIGPGSVTLLVADFTPDSVALFFALAESGAIIVPLSEASQKNQVEFSKISQIQFTLNLLNSKKIKIVKHRRQANNGIYRKLRQLKH